MLSIYVDPREGCSPSDGPSQPSLSMPTPYSILISVCSLEFTPCDAAADKEALLASLNGEYRYVT